MSKSPATARTWINVAYAAGGMPLLNKTLENNFGVHIDGNVEVDFYQFADIVDLLGGVEVDLRNDESRGTVTGNNWQLPFGGNKFPERSAGTGLRPHPQTGRRRGFQPDEPPAQSHHRCWMPTGTPVFPPPCPFWAAGPPPDHHRHDRQGDPRGYAVSLFPLMTGGEVVSQHIPGRRNLCPAATLIGMAAPGGRSGSQPTGF